MKNEEIMDKIMRNEKTLEEFFPYPTGSRGEAIAETDNHNSDFSDIMLKSFIESVVHLGAAVGGTRFDNKIAVKVSVRDLDFPVYFCAKDGRYTIAREVFQKDGVAPTKIYWRMTS